MGSKSRILGGRSELSGVKLGVDVPDSVNQMVGVLRVGNDVRGSCRRRVGSGRRMVHRRARKFPADRRMRGSRSLPYP